MGMKLTDLTLERIYENFKTLQDTQKKDYIRFLYSVFYKKLFSARSNTLIQPRQLKDYLKVRGITKKLLMCPNLIDLVDGMPAIKPGKKNSQIITGIGKDDPDGVSVEQYKKLLQEVQKKVDTNSDFSHVAGDDQSQILGVSQSNAYGSCASKATSANASLGQFGLFSNPHVSNPSFQASGFPDFETMRLAVLTNSSNEKDAQSVLPGNNIVIEDFLKFLNMEYKTLVQDIENKPDSIKDEYEKFKTQYTPNPQVF